VNYFNKTENQLHGESADLTGRMRTHAGKEQIIVQANRQCPGKWTQENKSIPQQLLTDKFNVTTPTMICDETTQVSEL
jgi:hypothetical protein